MSTRACIKFVDNFNEEMWFYRHSDGYPEGTLPTLNKFMEWLKEGRIRDNCSQSCGWLIIIGNEEYNKAGLGPASEPEKGSVSGWKVGAYEPTTGRHGDIEYLYEINLEEKTLKIFEASWDGSTPDKLIQEL